MDVVDGLCADLRLWKECLVREEGIGSDCAPSVYAFDGSGGLLGFAVLVVPPVDRGDQFRRLVEVVGLMREGWGAVGLAVALEGFLTVDEGAVFDPDGLSLAERFALGDGDVFETFSVVFREVGGFSRVHSMPYRQLVGRRVEWLSGLARDVSEGVAGGFPRVLERVFDVVVPVADDFVGCAELIAGCGFLVVSEFLGSGLN